MVQDKIQYLLADAVYARQPVQDRTSNSLSPTSNERLQIPDNDMMLSCVPAVKKSSEDTPDYM